MAATPPPYGSIVHCELYSDEPAATKRFYEDVFGWEFQEVPNAGYWIVKAPGRPHGGMLQRRLPKQAGGFAPPRTLNYILVKSVDDAVKRIQKAGGKVLVPKYEIPGRGWFAVFESPGGIVHNVLEAAPGTKWWE